MNFGVYASQSYIDLILSPKLRPPGAVSNGWKQKEITNNCYNLEMC